MNRQNSGIAFWRRVHRRAFSLDLEEWNRKFEPKMEVVCEEFEVVWPEENAR